MASRIQPMPEVEIFHPSGRVSMVAEVEGQITLAEHDDDDIGKRIGGSGQKFESGLFDEEHTPDLDEFEERIEAFDSIRKGVSPVFSALAKIRTPIIQADHRIDPGELLLAPPSETPPEPDAKLALQARLSAQLCEANLFGGHPAYRMRTTWRQFIGEQLSALWAGISVHEKVWSLRDGPLGEFIVYEELAWIHPRSIKEFVFDADDVLVGIVQEFKRSWKSDPTNPEAKFEEEEKQVFIPVSKLILWAPEPEGKNPEGLSLVRPMYADVKEMVALRRTNIVHAMKTAYAVPVFKFADGGAQITKARKEAATETIKRLRGGAPQNAFVVLLPGESIEWMEGGRTTFDPSEMIRERVRLIRAVVGAEASGLGQGGDTGSRNVGEVLEISKRLHVEAIAASDRETVQLELIEPLHRLNFGEDVPLPVYAIANIFPPNIQAIKDGVSSGILTIGEADEDWFRKAHGMPAKIRDEELKAKEKKPDPPKPKEPKPKQDPDDPRPIDGQGGPDDLEILAERPLPAERVKSGGSTITGIGRELSREPTAYELEFVPLAEIDRGFKAAETDFEIGVRQQFELIVDEVIESAKIVNGFPELLRPEGEALQKIMEDLADAMRLRGVETATKEIRSQLEAMGLGEITLAEHDALPGLTASIEFLTRAKTKAKAGQMVSVGIRLDLEKILNETVDAIRAGYVVQVGAGLTEVEALAAAGRAAKASAVAEGGFFRKLFRRMGMGQASKSFNQGRVEAAAGFREQFTKEGIDVDLNRARRSEILDDSTCDNCIDLDGTVLDMDTEEYWELMPPARCLGGPLCRGFLEFEIKPGVFAPAA